MNQLNKELSKMNIGKVLDIATRDGSFINRLSQNLSGYEEIIGIDISDQGFAKANEVFASNKKVRFEVMDGRNTLFPDHSFDLVCLSNSLHHIQDIPAVLREMKRLKKENGLILINELTADQQTGAMLTHALIHHLDCLINTYHGQYHHVTYTHEEIKKLLVENGLTTIFAFDEVIDDAPKNAAIKDRVSKVFEKVGQCWEALNYDEMCSMAQQIHENYEKYGAAPALQFISFVQ
jgi:ubiquinone/menaquinone biosynthesis C-methylase UbiE